MIKHFNCGDDKYVIDEFGVVHHENPKPFIYDETYASTYDTPEYVRNNDILQSLRWGVVVGAHGTIPPHLIDFGCGNGAFLKSINNGRTKAWGYDVSPHEIEGVVKTKSLMRVAVVTFWDALEHVQDVTKLVREIECHTICVSLPWCHIDMMGVSWFAQWKHRKPNEHLHHFNLTSIAKFMEKNNWSMLSYSNIEDKVRIAPASNQRLPNILTVAFRKK